MLRRGGTMAVRWSSQSAPRMLSELCTMRVDEKSKQSTPELGSDPSAASSLCLTPSDCVLISDWALISLLTYLFFFSPLPIHFRLKFTMGSFGTSKLDPRADGHPTESASLAKAFQMGKSPFNPVWLHSFTTGHYSGHLRTVDWRWVRIHIQPVFLLTCLCQRQAEFR